MSSNKIAEAVISEEAAALMRQFFLIFHESAFVEWTLNVILPEMGKKKRADFPVWSSLHRTLPLFQDHEMNQTSAVRMLNSHELEMACTLPFVALLERSSVIIYSCRWKAGWRLSLHNTSVGLNSKTASQNPPKLSDELLHLKQKRQLLFLSEQQFSIQPHAFWSFQSIIRSIVQGEHCLNQLFRVLQITAAQIGEAAMIWGP